MIITIILNFTSSHLEIHVFTINIFQTFTRFLCNPCGSFLHTTAAQVHLLFSYNISLLMCCSLQYLGSFFQNNRMLSPCSMFLRLFLLHYQVQSQRSWNRVYLFSGEDVLRLVCPPTKSPQKEC